MAESAVTPFISIHSLVKRETIDTRWSRLVLFDFNPLPRKEGDYRYQMEQACFV